MRTLILIAFLFPLASTAKAGTSSSFGKDDRSATVVVDNVKSADADFLWNLMATPVDQTSRIWVRRAATSNGLLEVECQRDTRVRGRTACVAQFQADDQFVVIGAAEKIAGITIMGDWGKAFLTQFIPKPSHPFAISPDESILQCWGCGGSLAEFTWSAK